VYEKKVTQKKLKIIWAHIKLGTTKCHRILPQGGRKE
jgi:hypothetical protein